MNRNLTKAFASMHVRALAIMIAVIMLSAFGPGVTARAADAGPASSVMTGKRMNSHISYENGVGTYAAGVELGEIFSPTEQYVWLEQEDFNTVEEFVAYCDKYGITPETPCPKSFDEFWDALGKKNSSVGSSGSSKGSGSQKAIEIASDAGEKSDSQKAIEIVDPVRIEGIADNYAIKFDYMVYPGRQKQLWAYTYASEKDVTDASGSKNATDGSGLKDIKQTDADETRVKWSSSDETVATVDENGLVTALSAGTTTITASVGEVKDAYELKVVDPGDRLTDSKQTVEKYDDLSVREKYNGYGQKLWRSGKGDPADTKWTYKYTKSGMPYSHEYVFTNKSDENPFDDYSDCDKICYNSEGGIRKVLRYENGKPYGKVLLYYDSNNRLKKIKRYTATAEGKWTLKWAKKYK